MTTETLTPRHPITGVNNTRLSAPYQTKWSCSRSYKEASFPVTPALELSLAPAGEAPRGCSVAPRPGQSIRQPWSTRRRPGHASEPAGRQTALGAGGWSVLSHTRHLHMSQPSSPFPPTVTMRILESISSLSLFQINTQCFEMKNGPGGRSQGRGAEDAGGR